MLIRDIELQISTCKKHLEKNSGSEDIEEIELFLTRYFLIQICGAYEQQIEETVLRRVGKTNDKHVISYVSNTFKGFRNVKLKNIRETLKKFDETCLTSFEQVLDATGEKDKIENCYGSITSNRQEFAHGRDGAKNLTLNDLEKYHEHAKKVIEVFSSVLEKY